MIVHIGAAPTDVVLVVPIFTESLADCSPRLERFSTLRLQPHMGARHAVTWFYGSHGEPDLVLVGLGEAANYEPAIAREAAGNAGRALRREKRAAASVTFEALQPEGRFKGISPDFISGWAEGMQLGAYSFDKYKSGASESPDLRIAFQCDEGEAWQEAIRLGELRAASTIWARDLTNEPPNGLRPRMLAERAIRRFAGTAVQVKLIEEEQLERQGFAGLAAVGKGSAFPPVFLELRYCTDESLPLTALIGKGITFDTGGISLKQDLNISDMRMDMGGAAAVLGALDLLVRSGAAANVAVLVPAAENCPSDRSMLPGETIRYANGLTVQVGNTDSEGRLILADALIHANRLGSAVAIDVATLTYAVIGALGSKIAAVVGDDGLAAELRQAGAPFGEKLWQMPLELEYEPYMDSDYADLCNISRVGEAGVITSSLFLRKFVDPSMRWAHIDMNGPKASTSAQGQYAVGATGFGVRLLASYLMNRPHD